MRSGIVITAVLALLVTDVYGDEWRWYRIAWEGEFLQSVVCPPDSEDVIYISVPWAMTHPEPGPGVYKSADRGLTWQFLQESENIECHSLTMDPKDPRTVYCGTSSLSQPPDYPWRSRDAGEHWDLSLMKFHRYIASPWAGMLIFATDFYRSLDFEYRLSRSTDDGGSWATLCSDAGTSMSDNVVFHSEDSLVVFAGVDFDSPDSVGLGRSTDHGATWEIVLEGEHIPGFDQDPFASQSLYLLHPGHTPGIYRSSDGGDTWNALNQGFDPGMAATMDMFLLKERPGEILAARTDGLWLWTDQQDGDRPDMQPEALRIESICPTPFAGTAEVRFVLPGDAVVTSNIYSLEGALVRHLFSEPLRAGHHLFSWEGRDVAGREVGPGVYVLKVHAKEQEASRYLVKLR